MKQRSSSTCWSRVPCDDLVVVVRACDHTAWWGDKAYTGRRHRAYCRRRGIRYTIPHQKHEPRRGPFDRQLYRRRHLVENLIGRFKQFRSLATRYDKLAESYRTFWIIAAILLWIRS